MKNLTLLGEIFQTQTQTIDGLPNVSHNKWTQTHRITDQVWLTNIINLGRRLNPDHLGTLILRGISDPKDQNLILSYLNQKNIRQTWSDESECVQIIAWDNELAEVAQAWADQCAMVEYRHEKSRSLGKL